MLLRLRITQICVVLTLQFVGSNCHPRDLAAPMTVLARTVQWGAGGGWLFYEISHEPHKPSLS